MSSLAPEEAVVAAAAWEVAAAPVLVPVAAPVAAPVPVPVPVALVVPTPPRRALSRRGLHRAA